MKHLLIFASMMLASLTPVKGGAVEQLMAMLNDPELTTQQVIDLGQAMFPDLTPGQVIDLLLGSAPEQELPAYAQPTGFERTGFEVTPFDSTNVPSPSELLVILAAVAERLGVVDDYQPLVDIMQAYRGRSMPSPRRITPLGLQWRQATLAGDTDAQVALAARIRAAEERAERIKSRGH